ncbi:TonB-linked SusC/RagA family outer membrane protein [Ancylomarina subtilis]|uniref:TonB-linked SusC/RagA family outer membrane protein n=1 Tax=Ancylomarina subtilis TaxID=1639035 RepID=A0A4Q7VK54_9BACT|nr:SusC/RagA family TonB-linked outer membrane protein [Ancylomarina subtilis]RZT96549.1 TonB-linked SusC/RagA family outer membrane protein [Ancylomarina subtilis]
MKKIIGLFVFLLLVGTQIVTAQSKQISGTVTSADDGLGMPGVSVVVKGTTIGASTDIDGKYSLEASASDVLVFSFVGMVTQEITVGNKTVVNVVLETESIGMDEVVVTALGVTREKKALGYAVQEVGADDLNQVQQSDALSALSGKVSGVQVSASSNFAGSKRILIRGANSIFGENQPLIVVDGIPMDNSNFNSANAQAGFGGVDYGNMMNDINPDDIENMSVLKGAAAAIYGSRAANGVIIINTKNAKAGKDDIKVDFSSSISIEKIGDLPALQRRYGGGAIIDDEDGGVNGFEQVTIEGNNYLVPQYAVDESWGPAYDPSIKVLHWDAFDKESFPNDYLKPRAWVAPKNDVKDFFDTGVSYVNSVAVARTGKEYGVRFSYTNTHTEGIVPTSEYDKHNFAITGNTKFLDKFNAKASINYVRSETSGRPTFGYDDNSFSQKFFQWGQRQLDMKRLSKYKNNDGTQRTWNRKSYSNGTPKYADNAYWIINENFNDDERDRFFGNVSIDYEIMKGLVAKASVYGDTYAFDIRERTAVGSQSTSRYYEAKRNNSEFNYEFTLNFNKRFNEDYNITAMVGANARRNKFNLLRGETSGGLVVPGIYNLMNSMGNVSINDFHSVKKTNSVFASASFGFKNFLFVDVTARNDWSSTLPENENSYFYPSISSSFVFSELFDATWMDYGKLRLGWAQVGNDTDPYRVVNTFEYNADGPFGGAPRTNTNEDFLNSELKSETTTSYEIGLEMNFLQNRFGFDMTYFKNVTTDQIIPLEVSKAAGYSSKYINAGEMENKGIEISLHATPVQINNFSWDINLNYSKIDNKLTELYKDIKAIDIQRAPFSGAYLRAGVGDTYGMLWGYDYIYDNAGNKVVDDNGYYLATDNLVPIGSVLPDYNIGIRNSLTYKNFDFSFLVDVQKGGKWFSLTHMWGMYSGMLEASAADNDKGVSIRESVANGGGINLGGVTGTVTYDADGNYTVTNTAENNKYVSGQGYSHRVYHAYGTPSAQNMFDADYIKLREVTLGYTFPKAKIGPLRSLKVSVYGKNLWTGGLDKKGFDPETSVGGSGNVQGIEGGFIPNTRTYGFNLKLGF